MLNSISFGKPAENTQRKKNVLVISSAILGKKGKCLKAPTEYRHEVKCKPNMHNWTIQKMSTTYIILFWHKNIFKNKNNWEIKAKSNNLKRDINLYITNQ